MDRSANFRKQLAERVIVADGAMGTMLYARGVFINRCFDELNIAQPSLVLETHKEYVRAGAEILEANTFGANRARLSSFGLAEKLQAPVVMSEGARGSLSNRHPLALFTLGGRAVLPHADVVLVAGSRFLDGHGDPFYTAPSAKLIYLNLDDGAFTAPRKPGVSILGDVRVGLEAMAAALNGLPDKVSRAGDVAKVRNWERAQTQAIKPQAEYAAALRENIADDETLISELTQVGYFANIAYEAFLPGTFLTPGFQGTLGYGFPTALGVSVGAPHKRTVSITGDGGFGWGLQDLATVAKYKLNLTIVVFVDGYFGNVRRIQRRVFGRETGDDLQNPDFGLLARAFGIGFESVDSPDGLSAALAAAKLAKGPCLIEVRVREMPSPWALIHPFVPAPAPPPPNPLGEPIAEESICV